MVTHDSYHGILCLFAFAYINADELCTCIKVGMLSSTLERQSCLQTAWDTAALVLWINADWNLTLKCDA
jgi:hypothetical protein